MGSDKKEKKRSSSPTQPPAWLRELLHQIRLIRQNLHSHATSIREIRDISLEIQNALRAINTPANVTASSRTRPAPVTTPARRIANPMPRSTVNTSRNRNNSVRDSAVPLPRPVQLTQNALPKICWYHRQFDQASVNCLPPCEFIAPVVSVVTPIQTPPPANQVSQSTVKYRVASEIRIPVERNNENAPTHKSSSDSSSSEVEPSQSSSNGLKAGDWNQSQVNIKGPQLSDSSDSESENSQSHKK